MELKVIKTEEEHEQALSALMALMEADPPAGSTQADRLEVLATLIENYEDEHFPIDVPAPVGAGCSRARGR